LKDKLLSLCIALTQIWVRAMQQRRDERAYSEDETGSLWII
jgi:hypothetical protein